LPFLADRAKNGVTGKEGYEGNGLSRRRQGFKSPWGRQQGIKAPAVMQVPFSLQALAGDREGFLVRDMLCVSVHGELGWLRQGRVACGGDLFFRTEQPPHPGSPD
ncbi:hypothetical protein, partial [Desulfovibrio piger]|uniref:hypothetical protein n=1 Tax=Desulfovibrio piger TaxID=901 RepID=UPI0026F33C49